MAKPRKKPAAPEQPITPRIGDKVTIPRSSSVLEVEHVSNDGTEVTLRRPGTNLQWFRIRADTLTYVDRKSPAKTSNPFTTPDPTLDAAAVLERIDIVRRESLKRMDDDIDVLKAEDAPQATIEALDDLIIDQHKSWKVAIEKVKKALG